MAIEFITGVPGGGKSYYACRLVVAELRRTKRRICTNLALDIPRLCEYLHEKYGQSFDAAQRIRILSLQECCEFWLYRGQGHDIDPTIRTKVRTKTREKASMDQIDYEGQGIGEGVLYIIDEVHVMFGSREWASTGADALYYLSQHRKMSDDVVLISQHTKQVETAFMRMCETFYFCRNLSKWKLPIAFGIFRSPPFLVVSEYKEASTQKPPVSTRTWLIDKEGIGSIYKTAAGVGFVGSRAVTEDKPQGFPSWAFALCVVAIMLGLWKLGGYAIASTIGSKQVLNHPAKRAIFPGTITNEVKPIVKEGVSGPAPEPLPLAIAHRVEADLPKESTNVFVVGHTTFKGEKWYLTDGRKVLASDPRFKMANNEVVVFGDKVYKWLPSDAASSVPTFNSNFHANRSERQ